jgi:methylase of polypeptide subunit release factors
MSQRESGYERKERDLYETPEWVTQALLSHLCKWRTATAWEPACGSGAMVRVLKRHFETVYAWDIAPDLEAAAQADFLFFEEAPDTFEAIITNPPYELAAEFCEQALLQTERDGGYVAMLLRTDFDHAKSRSHLFASCPQFAKKIVLTRRIAWFVEANGKPKASPSFNHAWYLWDWRHSGPPTIGYGP